MSDTICMLILCIVLIYVFFTSYYWLNYDFDFSTLNPIKNYKKWKSLNWFGVIICTLMINIFCLPYAIIYWLYKFTYFIFTIGRK